MHHITDILKSKSSVAVLIACSTETEVLLTRRFTWEVIQRHRRHRAIVLTTHSMEEADVLCDRIAIMVEGRLAAVGSSLDLKSQFGVGYTLTVVKDKRSSSQQALQDQPRCVFASCLALDEFMRDALQVNICEWFALCARCTVAAVYKLENLCCCHPLCH